jgi:Ca2+-binding EF-hand superfamily protein
VRQRTEIKKDEGIRSNSAFHFIDLEEKGLIDYQRFVAVLDRIGCKFTDK